ncbi:MAG: methyltransferase family protein [Anaerolineae bacterium]
MYVGWLAVALGVALVLHALWVILGTTAALLYLHHVTIPSEEQTLKARFGEAYAAYRDRVPWYL